MSTYVNNYPDEVNALIYRTITSISELASSTITSIGSSAFYDCTFLT